MQEAYSNEIGGVVKLEIDIQNKATYTEIDNEKTVTVQLASDEEAKQMIAEFEDIDGDLMYQENAIFWKYKELQQFRP